MYHFLCVTSRCLNRIQKIFKVISPSWKDFILIQCYLQNPWWSTWNSIFCHVNGGLFSKILCLPKTTVVSIQPKTKLFPWLLLWFLYCQSSPFLRLSAEVASSRTSMASRTSLRIHVKVFGLGLESYKSSKMSCLRLENSIVLWLVEKKITKRKIVLILA